jgi:N-acetylmuramoyl-L-alanine amidase
MTLPFAVCLLAAALPCVAQTVVIANQPDQATTTQPGIMNKTTVVVDAAHGGADNGAHIGDSIREKDVTLALALRLQAVLATRGLTVVMTRTTDDADKPSTSNSANAASGQAATGIPMTLDDRTGIANHARGSVCLLLHATDSGHGVHLFASELDGVSNEAAVLPWATAQAAWVIESVQLERRLAEALRQAGVPRLASKASVRPVDSLTCPAVVVEIAPETEDDKSVMDSSYQQRVADSIAAALDAWSKQVQPPNRLVPVPKPRPKPVQPTTSSGSSTPGVQP